MYSTSRRIIPYLLAHFGYDQVSNSSTSCSMILSQNSGPLNKLLVFDLLKSTCFHKVLRSPMLWVFDENPCWGCSAGSSTQNYVLSPHICRLYVHIYCTCYTFMLDIIHRVYACIFIYNHIYILYVILYKYIYQRKISKRCHKTKHIARYTTVLPCLHQSSISPSSNA